MGYGSEVTSLTLLRTPVLGVIRPARVHLAMCRLCDSNNGSYRREDREVKIPVD